MLATGCYAQASITDVLSMLDAMRAAQSPGATITAAQGDGTVITLTKQSGPTPHLQIRVTPGDGKSQMNQINWVVGTTLQTMTVGYGDALCLLAINPTAAAAVVGSLGNIPANTLAYFCTTNIDSSGVPTGQTAVVSGSIAWP